VYYLGIQENLTEIYEKVEKAKIRAGRKDDVKLIAVTKTVDIDRIKETIDLGITDIGENKVQELDKKIPLLGDKINYHMIGYLQTNKVKYIIDKVDLFHSLDRTSLAKELDKRAKQCGICIDALIQVNVAEEESKFGLTVEQVLPFVEELLSYENVRIRGLMTIAPLGNDEKLLRNIFSTMWELKENIKNRKYENIDMDYLSMGMTNDYEIAIEEGANLIRVGTGIFGKRNY